MSRRWSSLVAPARRLSPDLAFAVVATLVAAAVILSPAGRSSPLVILFALPFSLFFPGYVLVVALFPECREAATSEAVTESSGRAALDRGLSGVERFVLSVALSAVVVPLVGMALLLAGVELRVVPITVGIAAVVIVGVVVATYRRTALQPADRFEVDLAAWAAGVPAALRAPDTPTGLAVHVFLALSLLLAAGSGAYVVLAAGDDEDPYTEFYVLAENDSGDLVASGYPTTIQEAEGGQLAVAIANHEERAVNYTVVTQLQRVDVDEQTGATNVTQQTRVDTVEVSVERGERRIVRPQVTPAMTGDRLRLQFLLYRGDPPTPATPDTAYRQTHIWVNTTAS